MAIIPVNWRLEVKGSGEVKSELDRVSDAFNRAKLSGKDYAKEQRALSTTVSRRLQEDRLQNRLLLAQHPNLLRLSRSMSTLTSISRAALTISNALNLSKISGNAINTQVMAQQNLINQAQRDINELISKGVSEEDPRLIQAREDLILYKAGLDEIQEEIKNAKFDGFFTQLAAIGQGVGTTFAILIQNKTIMKGVQGAGNLFGTVFKNNFGWATKGIGTGISNTFTNIGLPSSATSQASKTSGIAIGKAFQGGFKSATGSLGITEPKPKIGSGIKGGIGGGVSGFLGGTGPAQLVAGLINLIPGMAELQASIIENTRKSASESGLSVGDGVDDAFKNFFDPFKKQTDQSNTSTKNNTLKLNDSIAITDKLSIILNKGNQLNPLLNETLNNNILTSELNSGTILQNSQVMNELVPSVKNLQLEFAKGFNVNVNLSINKKGNVSGITAASSQNLVTPLASPTSLKTSSTSTSTFGSAFDTRVANIRTAAEDAAWAANAFSSVTKAASGFEGVVNSPTMFLAGEAGSEQVSITPHGGRGGNGSGTIIVNIAGSVITEKQLAYKIDQIQKKALRSRGFTGS